MGFSPKGEYAVGTQYFGDGKTYGRELGRVLPKAMFTASTGPIEKQNDYSGGIRMNG